MESLILSRLKDDDDGYDDPLFSEGCQAISEIWNDCSERENHFDGFSFFYDQSSWDWETKEKNYYFSTYTTTPANLPKESR